MKINFLRTLNFRKKLFHKIIFTTPEMNPIKRQCSANIKNGTRCSKKCFLDYDFCSQHINAQNVQPEPVVAKAQCQAQTLAHKQCTKSALPNKIFCAQHDKMLAGALPAHCAGVTGKGLPCKHVPQVGSIFCWQHQPAVLGAAAGKP